MFNFYFSILIQFNTTKINPNYFESATCFFLCYFALSRPCPHLPFILTHLLLQFGRCATVKIWKSDQVGVQSLEILEVKAVLEERLKQEGIVSSRAPKPDKAKKRLKPVNGYCFCLSSLVFASFQNFD